MPFDQLPDGLHLVSAEESHGSHDPVTGRWDVGTLEVGERATLSLVATVDDGTKGSTLVNTASADVPVHHNDRPDNNEASAQVEVGSRQADIEVLKEVDVSTAARGREVIYTITVINHGPDVALGIVIDEELPTSLEITGTEPDQGSFDPDTNQWRVESLAAGESTHIHVRTTVRDNVSVGEVITNRAIARPLEGQGDDPDNNEATAILNVVGAEADLEVTKVVDRSSAAVGTDVVNSVVVVPGEDEPDPNPGNNISEAFLYVPLPTAAASPEAPKPGSGGRE